MFSNIQSPAGKLSFGRNAAKPGAKQSANEYKNRVLAAAAPGRLSKKQREIVRFRARNFLDLLLSPALCTNKTLTFMSTNHTNKTLLNSINLKPTDSIENQEKTTHL
jgi:hypothetical protein